MQKTLTRSERRAIDNEASLHWNTVTQSLIRNSKKYCDQNEAEDITSTIFERWLSFSDEKVVDILSKSDGGSSLRFLCGMAKRELLEANSETNYVHKKKVATISSDKLLEGSDCSNKSSVLHATADNTEYEETRWDILNEAIDSIESEKARVMYRLNKIEKISCREIAERFESSQSAVDRSIQASNIIVKSYVQLPFNVKRIEDIGY